MDQLFAEASFLHYLGVSLLLGGAVLYKLRKNQVRLGKRCAFGVLLLALLEVFCFLALPGFLGLSLFALSCLIFYVSISPGMLPVDSKAVLITGCDSGIGYALARYLDTVGFNVIAAVLNKDGQGAVALKSSCSQRLSLLQLDVTNSAQIKKAYEEVKAVLHNKGYIPMPGLSAYGASKAALSMFSGVMRQELSKWGVKVAAFYPGGFKTNICGSERQWDEQGKEILASIMQETRDDFGEDYIFKLKNRYNDMIDNSSADISPVLYDMHHALLAKKPNYMYTPGHTLLLLSLFHYFPLWIYDLVANRLIIKNKQLPCGVLGTCQHKSKDM
uniref:Estradiol 17-beta-dehydrogenase 2 isoform X2 n=1 Tax=Geotrypetes seraphini TaxID=260995 RepID=A0A6P8QKJ2_GEOSA|nr:estradiol 17-beta-dehydrogenase 2 isoform X2 [Geotrypetes seraphini]